MLSNQRFDPVFLLYGLFVVLPLGFPAPLVFGLPDPLLSGLPAPLVFGLPAPALVLSGLPGTR